MFIIISIAIAFIAFLIGMMIGHSISEGRKSNIDFEMYKVSMNDIEILCAIANKIRDEVSFDFYNDLKKLIEKYHKIVKRVYEQY